MTPSATLELQFFAEGEGWVLDRVVFCPGEDQEVLFETFRGDRFRRIGRTFAWTKAMRALCLLLVRYANNPETDWQLQGGRSSPAQTLFHLLEHPERSAAAIPFTSPEGNCYLKTLIEYANGGKDDQGQTLHSILVNRERLAPANLRMVVDGTPASADILARLATFLAREWPWKETTPPVQAALWQVELGRFPVQHTHFFGREEEFQWLSEVARGGRIAVLTGAGGSGKTALVSQWITRLMANGAPASGPLFGWSFGEQSHSDGQTMSIGECFEALAGFLKVDDAGGKSAYQQGRELAQHVSERGCAIVLDGIETLQLAHGAEAGAPHDPGLRGFLHGLAAAPGGYCLLTSRLPLSGFPTALHLRLEPLAQCEALALLQAHRVTGTADELQRIVNLSRGNPLTLHLIGGYIAKVHDGKARALAEETFWLHEDGNAGSQARAIMGSYEARLAGSPHEAALGLLSLFDRSITFDQACDFVFEHRDIAQIGGRFSSPTHLLATLRDLVEWELAAMDERLECHPLVTQHFRESFRNRHPQAYREAHSRLYHAVVNDPDIPTHPETPRQYNALLQAFFHGREAGMLAECWREVAWRRIMRSGREYHMTAYLGEFHLCLRAWASFWETPWERLHPDLPQEAYATVQASAGFGLFMIERVAESERVIQRALKNAVVQVKPHLAIQAFAVRGYMRLRQGRLAEARRDLLPVAGLARWVGKHSQIPIHVRLAPICHLGQVYTLQGHWRKGARLFDRAKALYHGAGETELPPLLLLSYWESLLFAGQLATFHASYVHSAALLEAIPLVKQIGALPRLEAEAAWREWCQGGNPRALERAEEKSTQACLQTERSGLRLFHVENLSTRAEILRSTGREKESQPLVEEALTLASLLELPGIRERWRQEDAGS